MNRILLKGMAALICLSCLFIYVSCSDDDDDKKEVSVTGVTLDRTTATLAPGATLTLVPAIAPANASNTNVSWSSSSESVATVAAGVVTAVAEGSATITVTTADGSHKATCSVTVEAGAVTGEVVELEGNITSDITLRAIDANIITGHVYVEDGATLTVEAGAVVKGNTGKISSLVVKRGGKLIAEGTKDKPIVFTSDKPVGERGYGDWGGIILCGKAPTNNYDPANEPKIEGGVEAWYGGNDPADNSGILKYVRIEFCGYPFEPDKEINGLTCGAVGSGTTLEYIQVSYCGDDSFEWFGGTVNAKHLIAYKGWDDEFDTDNGYNGKLQFLLGVRDPNVADTSKSNGFESDNDGDGSTNQPVTNPIFSNVTLIGPFYGENYGKADSDILYTTNDAPNGARGGQFQAAMHIRRYSALEVYNSVFTGWPYGLYLQTTNPDAVIRNCIIAGMWKDFYDDASETYFTLTGLNNQVLASSNEVIAKNGDYSSVVTDAITGADFTASVLQDSFFEKVSYKGAFDGTNDWTAGWANFDPQNAVY